MSYKLEEGHKAIAEGFSELVNNRNNFQDAITLDVQDVRTTVLDIKQTVNATCRLADQTVAVLLGDDHINQEGKVVDSENVIGLEELSHKLNKELINLFANASGETKSVTNEVKEIVKDQTETLRDKIYEHGWNDDSIAEMNGCLNDIDNNVDDLTNTISGIEDCVNNMGDLDLGSIEIVSDKLDDLTATLDRTDLSELNSDINTLSKVCIDNRADLARIHESMNAQFNNISERRVKQFQNVSERLTEMSNATDVQFNNMKETWFNQELTIQKLIEDTINDKLLKPIAHINSKITSDETGIVNFIQVSLPQYFETMKGSLEHLIDEKFIKYNQQLQDQTHSQIEDQEGSLVAIETKMDTLDSHVKKLLGNIAFLEDFSEKSTDKELGDKIHYAIANGFTNLNSHVEDIVTEVKRIKEETILTNYDAHTNNSQTESLEENQNG
tara:strand:- start:832 stop:2157 length:1326 start_codon:yes stop_codon:yes gene_type:complete